ncbi:MAG: fumarylacetoacetate hydrolase family protein [Luminiphilus sp.]
MDELKRFLSLDDYDIVMTGTPAGVGPVERGDRFEAVLRDGDVTLVKEQWLAQ